MTALWDQLSLSEPLWYDIRDVELYAKERDEFRVYQFTLALNDEFESVRSSLLHRDPFPKLEIVVTELLSEEARLATLKSQQSIITTDTVLATPASSQSQNKVTCRELMEEVCKELAHKIAEDKAIVETLKMESINIREQVEEERKMLQIAEAWCEERVHMKMADAKLALDDKYCQMNKFIADLEAFLRSRGGTLDVGELRKLNCSDK
ncbi:hypothetical protein GH714_000772 [Hevea brasiliensis]|uniref:Uncharacterized protein n=1 Tax=Hevea brasiliensis TaxID=3981 RepID=A0A6A6LWS5_HEVBR|nr:hypothetical protein GH714_000772 [Hevea brasiliensis]